MSANKFSSLEKSISKELLKSNSFLQDSGGHADVASEDSRGLVSVFSSASSESSRSGSFSEKENGNANSKRKYAVYKGSADSVYSEDENEDDTFDDYTEGLSSGADDNEEAAEICARGLDKVSNCSSSTSASKSDCNACFCTQEEARAQKINLERCKTCREVFCGACGLFECSRCNANLCGECKLTVFEDWVCFNCLDSIVQLNGFNLV